MEKKFFSKTSDSKQTISGKKQKNFYNGFALGFLQLTGHFFVPVGDVSFFSFSLPLFQLTQTFA